MTTTLSVPAGIPAGSGVNAFVAAEAYRGVSHPFSTIASVRETSANGSRACRAAKKLSSRNVLRRYRAGQTNAANTGAHGNMT